MIARLCVWWVNSFLVFALVVLPVASSYAAQHYALGYNFSKQLAENSAINRSKQHCASFSPQLLFQQEGATSFWNAPPFLCGGSMNTCKGARVNYNCVTPPPQSTSRRLFGISGNWHCDESAALQSFENAATTACQNIDPRVDWFVDEFIPLQRSTQPTGACGGVDDGWYTPTLKRWRGDAICKLYY